MFEQDSPDNNRVQPLAFDGAEKHGATLPGATLPVAALDLSCEPRQTTHPQPSPVAALDFPAGDSHTGAGSVQAPSIVALELPEAPKPAHTQTIQVGGLDFPDANPRAGTIAPVRSIQVGGLDMSTSPAVLPVDLPSTHPPSAKPVSPPASPPPASLPPARPQAVFAVNEDPIILAGLRHFKEQFPDKYDQNESAMASRLRKLLPMSFDKISAFAENTVGHVGNMVQEVTEATQNIAALSTADTVSGIINEAREAASMQATSGGHGLSAASLFKKLESKLRPFDPQAAANTLMRLYGGLKSIHGRVAGISKTAGDLLPGVQLDIMAMSVMEYMAENTSFAPAAQHRHQIVLTLGIQLEMVTKQSVNLLKQTETNMMQLEDVRNVTLPSLGFLVAVKNT
jgi:hypothetical protein